MDWRAALTSRLIAASTDDGAWGYGAGDAGWSEPTALAALALIASDAAADQIARPLNWLARTQLSDGAVPVSRDIEGPFWPTALAVLAWLNAPPEDRGSYTRCVETGVDWLLEAEGNPLTPNPAVYDHDTSLIGWSWVADTHSWIEPTSYAVAALRAVGRALHPRTREGVELILDRGLPDGGWNYGNRRVLENVLRPFPATTGVALTALAGEPRNAVIDQAAAYLNAELPRIRAPLSLAWSLLGLRAWDAAPPDAEMWLEESAERLALTPARPHYSAMLMLAGAERYPLWTCFED